MRARSRPAARPGASIARALAPIRWWIARAPWTLWASIAALALTTGWLVAREVGAADAARASWGPTRSVWVATRDTDAGQPLTAVARRYPGAVVPPGAVSEVPAAARARQRVDAGEIVTTADLVAAGPAARIPAGQLAVAVPRQSGTLAVGDWVAALADGRVLARGTVVALTETAALVAVADQAAGPLAQAAVDGRVSLALSATPPG